MRFNLVNFLFGLVVGWFMLAFLHAMLVSMGTGGSSGLVQRAVDIALFRDGRGAVVNVVVAVVAGALGTGIWLVARAK